MAVKVRRASQMKENKAADPHFPFVLQAKWRLDVWERGKAEAAWIQLSLLLLLLVLLPRGCHGN